MDWLLLGLDWRGKQDFFLAHWMDLFSWEGGMELMAAPRNVFLKCNGREVLVLLGLLPLPLVHWVGWKLNSWSIGVGDCLLLLSPC